MSDVRDTLRCPASSTRFKTTAQLHALSGIRYGWLREGLPRRDIIVTGSDGSHVRAYELIDHAADPEDEMWSEMSLSTALQEIAGSGCFTKDRRHSLVRTYLLGWAALHAQVEELERGAA